VFYSSIICERDKIEEIIDARTSDAISLALRFQAPIFTYKNILDKAGIYLKGNTDPDKFTDEDEVLMDEIMLQDEPSDTNDLNKKSLQELHTQLEQAVNNEDYELAAKLRDEISKRN